MAVFRRKVVSMEMAQSTPALRDLFTILFKPRETMRRILDARDRWTIQIVVLACICSETNDIDPRAAGELLPYLKFFSIAALAVLIIVAIAISWVVILFVLSWLATFTGHLLGGTGTARNVRAALSWAMVPVIWSVIYRVPLAIYKNQVDLRNVHVRDVRDVLLNFVAHGGCALIVVVLALQIIFFVWSIFIATNTLAEAQRFSTEKGFVNLVITLAFPLLVIAGAIITFRK
jgi:Yip1-like protein